MVNGMYSKKVMEYFRKPHNMGRIEDADGIGKVGNVVCGDIMHLYIKVFRESDKEIISDIKFETMGCVAAIATSSMVTDLAKGKYIDEALKITKDEIVKALEGLPPVKIHCSLLAVDALKEALYDYFTRNKREIPEILKKDHERIRKEYETVCKKHA